MIARNMILAIGNMLSISSQADGVVSINSNHDLALSAGDSGSFDMDGDNAVTQPNDSFILNQNKAYKTSAPHPQEGGARDRGRGRKHDQTEI